MKRYEYQVSFFLNKEQNEAFTEYCTSKNVAPYIAGKDIVKDFMMSEKDAIEQTLVKDDHEDRIEVLEDRIEAMTTALGVQVEKCEKLEEEISSLQEEINGLANEYDLDEVKEDLVTLWDKHYELDSKID